MTTNNQSIGLAKWCNQKQEYTPIATITPTYANIKDSSFNIARFPTFKGSLPIGLSNISKSSNIPPLLREFLPSGFSSKLISATIPEWKDATDFERLQIIGNREVGAYTIFNLGLSRGSTPIIGEAARDLLADNIVILEGRAELHKLLNAENFYSLTTLAGGKAKFEYQDHLGNRHIVKMNALDTPELSRSANIVQHLLTEALGQAKAYSSDTEVVKTTNGNSVIISKRYDYHVKGADDSKQIIRNQQFTASSLANISIMQQMKFNEDRDSNQLEKLIDVTETYSESPVDDRKLLMRRYIFSMMTNQSSFAMESINFIEQQSGKFRLAPVTATLPNRYDADYPLHINGYHQQHHQKFDTNHIEAIAKTFNFTPTTVKTVIVDCAKSIAELPTLAKLHGCDMSHYKMLTEKMISPTFAKIIDDVSVKNQQKQSAFAHQAAMP